MHERDSQVAGCLECDSRRDSDLMSWDLRKKNSPRNVGARVLGYLSTIALSVVI